MGLWKVILFTLAYAALFGCGQEATNFDVSKNIEFPVSISLPVDAEDVFIDTLLEFTFKQNKELREYKKHAKAYRINQLSYGIVTIGSENTSSNSSFIVTWESTDNHVTLLENASFDISIDSPTEIPISATLLSEMSSEVDTQGSLSIRLQVEPNTLPASFVFSLFFDTTVTIDFK